MRWFLIVVALLVVGGCTQKPAEEPSNHRNVPQRTGAIRLANQASGTYTLAPESRFEVKTGKAGMLGGVAHEHLIRAGAFSGQIDYDPAHLEESHFTISVRAEGLLVLTAAKPSDKVKIRDAMLTKVLKAAEYPEIRFVSRKVAPIENGVRVEGDLTLVGTTHPLGVDVALKPDGEKLVATGTFSINQTDWGIKPYKAGLGTIKVADKITFDFEAIGTR